MHPTKPTFTTGGQRSSQPLELLQMAEEYAQAFNAVSSIEDIDRLIADACIDPFWDDRTNLLSLLADNPEDLGLVLASDPDDYVIVRYVRSGGHNGLSGGDTGKWVVDTSPVDWDALEDEAFDESSGATNR